MDLTTTIVIFVVLSILVVVLMRANSGGGGGAGISQARSFLGSAQTAKSKGDAEQAIMQCERAVELIDRERKPDEALLSSCLSTLAECMERVGRQQDAKAVRKRMISVWESALNARRMAFFTDIDYMCTTADFGGSTRDVADFYEKLLGVREKTTQPNSSEFTNTVMIYSRLLRALGENQTADDLEKHANKLRRGGSSKLELEEDTPGSDVGTITGAGDE